MIPGQILDETPHGRSIINLQHGVCLAIPRLPDADPRKRVGQWILVSKFLVLETRDFQLTAFMVYGLN